MKHKLAYFVLCASTILLILNLYDFIVNNEYEGFYLRILSNILLIAAMIFTIKARNKLNKN